MPLLLLAFKQPLAGSQTSDYCPLERFIRRSRYYKVDNYEEWQKLCKAKEADIIPPITLHTATVCGGESEACFH